MQVSSKKKTVLNLGSGQRRFESTGDWQWVNIDCVSRPPDQVPDLICDVGREPLPYEDESVDCVVLHHCAEHWGCGEGDACFRECARVLKKEGRIFVFVPDMQALAVGWLQGRITTQIYMTNVYGAFQGLESDRHRWGWDAESLGIYLSKWFDVVHLRMPPNLPGADIAWDWWILGMEGIKT